MPLAPQLTAVCNHVGWGAAVWCVQGKAVVRLKGGCPSTFSRVSSEAAALAAAGLNFEMWPGVSSATAASVLAGTAGHQALPWTTHAQEVSVQWNCTFASARSATQSDQAP